MASPYSPTDLQFYVDGYHTSWEQEAAFPLAAQLFNGMFVENNTSATNGDQLTTTPDSKPGEWGASPEESPSPQQASKRRRQRRKPTTSEQINRRREQNRLSQKNYRERKESKINELETKLKEVNRQNKYLEQLIHTLKNQMSARSTSPSASHADIDVNEALPEPTLDEQLYDFLRSSNPMSLEPDAAGMESETGWDPNTLLLTFNEITFADGRSNAC